MVKSKFFFRFIFKEKIINRTEQKIKCMHTQCNNNNNNKFDA